jgi:thiamine-phosphate pyrophosphorylase
MSPMPLPERVLCLVTALDPCEDPTSLLVMIRAAIRGGVNMIQVRAPELERTEFFNLSASVMETVGDDALVLINNRVDVALAVDASGVQLGERGPAVKAARNLGGDDWVIGRSVHSLEGAQKAESDQADFLMLGTIYETTSHPGQKGAGLDLVRNVAGRVGMPIIGIGGVNPERAADVVSAGAIGVAVIGGILRADDPERAAADLRKSIEDATPG